MCSRFSWSVETYQPPVSLLVEDDFRRVRLFRALITRCPSEGGGTREAGGIVVRSLVRRSSMRKRKAASSEGANARFGENEGQFDRQRAGNDEPSKARVGRFLEEKLISDSMVSFPPSRDVFQGSTGL